MKSRHIFCVVIVLFLVLRVFNLTVLPIFNDEAIYIHWGWREIHNTGELFYSLLDAKPPLLMWLFGLSGSIFSDPLWAARIISVATGLCSVLGIYVLGRQFFSKKAGLIASALYISIPLFAFYDRQALMESALSALGIWSAYVFVQLYRTHRITYAFWLGAILGVGFMIKGTVMIYLLSALILLIYKLIKDRDRNNILEIQNIVVILVACAFVSSPLLMQPLFWQTFGSNSRYALSISEIAMLPLHMWYQNGTGAFFIMFWYLTPIAFILSLFGMWKIIRTNEINHKILVGWFSLGILFFIVFDRTVSLRYLVPLLPLTTIFIAYAIVTVSKVFYKRVAIIAFTLFIPLYLTVIQLINPTSYFELYNRVTAFSQYGEYVTGWTSGYGIPELRLYINKHSRQPAILGVRPDAGNPESAIFAYYSGSELLSPMYLNSSTLGSLKQFSCTNPGIPVYFISRDTQFAGLENYLSEERKFYKPTMQHFIGLYQFRIKC